MYKIKKDNELIAMTEKLNFIKQTDKGIFVSCNEKDAQGIAVKNTPYNLLGRKAMASCETVFVFEVDGGECIKNTDENQIVSDALVVDHEYRITLIEMGVIE